MAAYFVDLDGTFFLYGTNKLAPGAENFAKEINRRGDKIYFVTARKVGNVPKELNIEATHVALKELGIFYELIIDNCPSPRILINDQGASAVNIDRDEGLCDFKNNQIPIIQRIHDSLRALSWVNAKYGDAGDADDFVQTIIVAESLLINRGFNHEHLVSSLRATPKITYHNKKLEKGGVKTSYKGQISKLLNSSDRLFTAVGGVSDGAAMRTLGIGAFYRNNYEKLFSESVRIASITHGSNDAKLSSLLTSIRFAQLFSGDLTATPMSLYVELMTAAQSLMSKEDSEYFLEQSYKAARLASRVKDPEKLLRLLAKHIGITHLAWGTPIAATFWSFHETTDFNKYFRGYAFREILLSDDSYNLKLLNNIQMPINLTSFSNKQKRIEVRYLKKIGELEDFKKCHGHHYSFLDIDTFFSIAISLLAARNGIKGIYSELSMYSKVFNLDDLALATYLHDAGNLQAYEYESANIYR